MNGEKLTAALSEAIASLAEGDTDGVETRIGVAQREVSRFVDQAGGRLDEVIARRKRNADLYRRLIRAEEVFIPAERESEGYKDSYVMFIVQAERRDALQAFLRDKGVETLIYYGMPLHLHKAAERLGYKRGDLPVAEAQCDKVLALPHNQQISEDQVAYVADQVNAFYGV